MWRGKRAERLFGGGFGTQLSACALPGAACFTGATSSVAADVCCWASLFCNFVCTWRGSKNK